MHVRMCHKTQRTFFAEAFACRIDEACGLTYTSSTAAVATCASDLISSTSVSARDIATESVARRAPDLVTEAEISSSARRAACRASPSSLGLVNHDDQRARTTKRETRRTEHEKVRRRPLNIRSFSTGFRSFATTLGGLSGFDATLYAARNEKATRCAERLMAGVRCVVT